MGLIEELDKLKDVEDKVLLDGEEEEKEEAPLEEPKEEEEKEEDEPDEEPKEEIKEEPKDPKEAKVSGYQNRKIKEFEQKAKEAQERADKAERQYNELASKLADRQEPREVKQEPVREQIPDKTIDPDAYVDYMLNKAVDNSNVTRQELQQIKTQQLVYGAKNELSMLEMEYIKKTPEYNDALKFAEDREVAKAKILNPNITEAQVRQQFSDDKLKLAAHFAQQGKDVVDNMFNYVVQSYGYQSSKPQGKDELKNFEAVKKNKKVSPLSVGGASSPNEFLSPAMAKDMTLAELTQLTPQDRDRIFTDTRH